MNELARLEGESRERASRTLAGAKERQNDLIMSYYDAFAQEKAVEEINTANEQLGQLGILYEPIPINRNTITEQRKSGGVWAQNYITYTEAADKKARREGAFAEAEKWARWSIKQKGGNWNDLSPRQQEGYRNWWFEKILEETQAPGVSSQVQGIESPFTQPEEEFTPVGRKALPLTFPNLSLGIQRIPPIISLTLWGISATRY